ncbi:B9 domain-containing protein 1 isoform X3 [Anastrepha obliqua]|uniref:B9 domain-containing protein 1 isoform X3 n=1 Tax=Anastrepha obliqua TaxID=95512 RepID=UPI002408F9A6|nr:B9 domain-containing protein 1 isoform X3 [Anastrepha obliqua]
MPDSPTTASYFNIFITGQIEAMEFPLGPNAAEVFCRYEVVAGPDWELISGSQNGISQTASNKSGFFKDKIVFNFPLEWTFKSTTPFGWPQLIISIYGKTRWGAETTLGYCRINLPVFGSHTDDAITAPILIPRNTNMVSELASWITGRNPELKDPKTLLSNGKLKESYGEVIFKLTTILRGTNRLGYDWG